MTTGTDGAADPFFQPDPQSFPETQLDTFIRYCERQMRLEFGDYLAFESFAVDQFRAFWSLFLRWLDVVCEGDCEPVCTGDDCETAVFFPRLKLNYAENLLREEKSPNGLIGCHADGSCEILTRNELRDRVTRLALFL